jgi:hypothetical protein
MLKRIKFTFTVDPKDLALLLAHAGQLDVEMQTDQPKLLKGQGPLALAAPDKRPRMRDAMVGILKGREPMLVRDIVAAMISMGFAKNSIYTGLRRDQQAGVVKMLKGKHRLDARYTVVGK